MHPPCLSGDNESNEFQLNICAQWHTQISRRVSPEVILWYWIDYELKHFMAQRNVAKEVSNKSGWSADWLTYCKLRNVVIKLNKKALLPNKNKLHETQWKNTLYLKLYHGHKTQLISIVYWSWWVISMLPIISKAISLVKRKNPEVKWQHLNSDPSYFCIV